MKFLGYVLIKADKFAFLTHENQTQLTHLRMRIDRLEDEKSENNMRARHAIAKQRKHINNLEKQLADKVRDCGACKTCNDKYADMIFTNQHGGIIHK